MEAVAQHHDVAAAAAPARELDRALVGLGARVGEEHLAAQRALRQPLRPAASRARCRRGCQTCISRPGLLADRLDQRRVAVADLHHRDAGQEVEVLVALGVPEPRALAAHELDGLARVGAASRSRARAPGGRRGSRATDLRADALVGEQLEQQRVRLAPVDDVRAPDAAVDRLQRTPRAWAASRR